MNPLRARKFHSQGGELALAGDALFGVFLTAQIAFSLALSACSPLGPVIESMQQANGWPSP